MTRGLTGTNGALFSDVAVRDVLLRSANAARLQADSRASFPAGGYEQSARGCARIS